LVIRASVNNRQVDWIVDTGMNISMISESEAQMLGISVHRLRANASDLAGGTVPVGAAVADELRIGECDVRNVPLVVLPDSRPPMDELARGERGIIGLPVLLALGTLRWSADGTFEIGGPSSPGASPTLCFDELLPIVRVEWEGKPLDFVLDTGNVAGTQLWERFALEQRHLMEKQGAKAKEWLVTIGSSGYREVVRIPRLGLRIGGLEVTLRPANVFSRPVGNEHHHGLLGMDLLDQAREVTIDFRSMSVGLR
jgi:predicted aspartyl protease